MAASATHASDSDPSGSGERLSLGLKILFGAPSFAGAAMVIPIGIHLTKFYADQVLVPLGWLGIAIAIARAFDAITDPAMGWISDRTRTRWGRRRPWIALGAPACGVAFVLLFSPPAGLTPGEGFVWFAATFLLYHLFHTVYLVPYMALGAELSPDYHDRSRLFSIREGFLLSGTMSAAVLPGVLTESLGSEPAAFRAFSLVFGAVLALLYCTLAFRVREHPEYVNRPANPLVPGVRRALRNRPFRLLLGAGVFGAIPGAITGTLLPFFNAYVLQPENEARWLMYLLAGYFGSALLFLPVWLRAAQRLGKRTAKLWSYAVGSTGLGALFFAQPGDTWFVFVFICVAGSAFGAMTFLGFAMKADVIDYDELHTGRRREAQFTSFWTIVPKLVQVPAAALPIAVLGVMGYAPNQPQTPEVVMTLRLLVTMAPMVGLAAAFVCLWRYPIGPEEHVAIRRAVAARARGEAVHDPVSGRLLGPRAGAPVDEETGWFLDHFSPAELRRVLSRGPAGLVRDVTVAAAGSLALCLGCAGAVALGVSDPSREPGVGTVAAVVAAGGALTAFLFHVARLASARRFARAPLPASILRAHLGTGLP